MDEDKLKVLAAFIDDKLFPIYEWFLRGTTTLKSALIALEAE